MKKTMHKSCLSLLALLFTVTACNADSTSEQTTTAQQNTQAQTADGNWYRPSAGISWQWQLSDTVNTSYDVDLYDIDLFDSSPELIKSLQSQGRKVICYFSAGSYEQWREDAKDFQSSELGKPLDGWDEERWLDIRSANVSAIMQYIIWNELPTALGNLVGGLVFVGLPLYYTHVRTNPERKLKNNAASVVKPSATVNP